MSDYEFVEIPPERTLLHIIKRGLKEAGYSQRKLAEIMKTDQPSISKKLSGKRRFNLDEVSFITSLILERVSSIPHKPISELYVASKDVAFVSSAATVGEAAKMMIAGGFTQLPVIEKETSQCVGIITDLTLLRRILSPTTVTDEKWIRELKIMEISKADVIDETPSYPSSTPMPEIAQALLFHYAVLISEAKGRIGIVTRADFLRLLAE